MASSKASWPAGPLSFTKVQDDFVPLQLHNVHKWEYCMSINTLQKHVSKTISCENSHYPYMKNQNFQTQKNTPNQQILLLGTCWKFYWSSMNHESFTNYLLIQRSSRRHCLRFDNQFLNSEKQFYYCQVEMTIKATSQEQK